MKTQTTNFFMSLDKNEIKQLTKEVKETVAVNCNEHKTFSAADLWNIQKMGRTARTSRRLFI